MVLEKLPRAHTPLTVLQPFDLMISPSCPNSKAFGKLMNGKARAPGGIIALRIYEHGNSVPPKLYVNIFLGDVAQLNI